MFETFRVIHCYFKQASSRLHADLLSVGERSFWRPSRFRRRTRASISTDGLLIIYLVLLTGDMKWVPNLHQCRRRKARSSSLSSRNFGGNCISGLLLVSSMSVFFLLLFLFLTLGFLLVSFSQSSPLFQPVMSWLSDRLFALLMSRSLCCHYDFTSSQT